MDENAHSKGNVPDGDSTLGYDSAPSWEEIEKAEESSPPQVTK